MPSGAKRVPRVKHLFFPRYPQLKPGGSQRLYGTAEPVPFQDRVLTHALKSSVYAPERSRGFEAATARGADAFTRGIRLKTRSPGLKSRATPSGPAWLRNQVWLQGGKCLQTYHVSFAVGSARQTIKQPEFFGNHVFG